MSSPKVQILFSAFWSIMLRSIESLPSMSKMSILDSSMKAPQMPLVVCLRPLRASSMSKEHLKRWLSRVDLPVLWVPIMPNTK